MLLYIAKFLSTFFATLVVAKSYLNYKQKREGTAVTVFWVATWLFIVYITYFPWVLDKVATPRTGLGTVLGICFVFIFFVCYRIYIKVDRVEKNFHRLVREIALKDKNK